MSHDCAMGVQISGQTFGELRIVPDMHTRKVNEAEMHRYQMAYTAVCNTPCLSLKASQTKGAGLMQDEPSAHADPPSILKWLLPLISTMSSSAQVTI